MNQEKCMNGNRKIPHAIQTRANGYIAKTLIMKIAFFFICLVVFQINTLAQDWIKYYGQGQNAIAWNVTEQSDKGYLIAGGINLSTYS